MQWLMLEYLIVSCVVVVGLILWSGSCSGSLFGEDDVLSSLSDKDEV